MANEVPDRQVRAVFDADTITVYQAYSVAIARPAVAAQTFVAPFKRERMTWIKPSFLWMMYRSGWATKPGQEHVLAVQIARTGFEEALSLAVLSHYDREIYRDPDEWQTMKEASPVRVQWDPERDPQLAPLPWRSVQIGLRGPAVDRYLCDWIITITDITEQVRIIATDPAPDHPLLPAERPYPLPDRVAMTIGATQAASVEPSRDAR